MKNIFRPLLTALFLLGMVGGAKAQTYATSSSFSASSNAANFGQAVNLPGDVSIKVASAISITTSSSETFECRVRVASAPSNFQVFATVLTANQPIGAASPYWLGLQTSGAVHFNPDGFSAFDAGNIADGNWHTVAWVVTNGTSFAGYIDGVQVGSSTGTAVAVPNAQITLGDFGATDGHYYFTGQIDEAALSSTAQYAANYTPATAPFAASRAGLVDLLHLDGNANDAEVAAPPLVTPAIAVTFAGNVPTFAAPASGGFGALSYAWARSTTPGFAFSAGNPLANGSGITGAATNALTDGSALSAGTTYYYRYQVSDSSSPANVSTSTQRPFVLPSTAPIKLIAIGDSQSARQAECNFVAPIDVASRALNSVRGLRVVSVVDAAVSGSNSYDWLSGSSNLNNAMTMAGGSLAGYYVFYRIGVNNAQGNHPASAYQSDLSNTISAILAQNPAGLFLSYSLPREPGVYGEVPSVYFDESCTPLELQYQAIQAAAVTGKIYLGDTQSYTLFALYPQLYFSYGTSPYSLSGPQGAIHESQVGAEMMGANEANALLSVLYPAAAGPAQAPVSLALTITHNGSNQPVLTWVADPLGTLYLEERSTDGINYVVFHTEPAGTLTDTDTARPNAVTVYYHVVSRH